MTCHAQRSKQSSGAVSFTSNISQSHLPHGCSSVLKLAAALANSCPILFLKPAWVTSKQVSEYFFLILLQYFCVNFVA
jgi:hypothetical protein